MKLSICCIGIIIFLSYSCSENKEYNNDIKTENQKNLDPFLSLIFDVSLQKSTFYKGEPITIFITARNKSNEIVKFWLNCDDHPVGNNLALVDSLGVSKIKAQRAWLSSQIYSDEEVEKMKTTFLPKSSVEFSYKLRNIVRLNEELEEGVYKLWFGSSDTLQIIIK